MEYAIIINGRSYELPKKTLSVTEKLDEVLKVDSIPNVSVKQKYEKLHRFVKDVLGEDNAAEILGSSALSEIDLSELALVVLKINDAYEKALLDYRTENMESQINSIPLEKIVSMTKAAQTIGMMKK